jgi:hypothetical protein
LAWPAISTSLLGAVALGIAAQSRTALSAPTLVLASRWRPLDPAWSCSSGSTVALLTMSKLVRRVSMGIVELAEHGAHVASGVFILDHLDGVDDVVEWCAQAHDSDVRGVLL